ncbi:class I SAM-dependent methyltransferase [Thiolapillus sp.]
MGFPYWSAQPLTLNPYASTQRLLQLEKALPYTEHWSAAADFLNLLVEHCLENKPGNILECSSGLSTLVLARCCQLNQCGLVFSLENDANFAADTRAHLQTLELADHAQVIHAPLRTYSLERTDFEWYSTDSLPETSIDLLVIDGPPGYIQPLSRYPALPLLAQRMKTNSVIFLDDAARDQEKKIISLWQKKYPGLKHTYIDTERGCSVLQYG